MIIKDRMRNETMFDSIIFDLDGTLWNSTDNVAIAYNKVLEEKYPELNFRITAERLQSLFGRPLDDIAVILFPDLSKDQAIKVIDDCGRYECEYLAEQNGKLYDGLEETLQELKKRYQLFIVSNCQEGYVQCFFQANPHLEQYFIDFEYPGRSGKLKAENIRLIIERNNLKNPIYVGDTQGDADSSKKAGVPFVYAKYGFGQVAGYEQSIDCLHELLTLLP